MSVESQVEKIHKQLQESTKETFGRELDSEEILAALFRLRDERLAEHILERIGHLEVERILAYVEYIRNPKPEPVTTNERPKAKAKKRAGKAKGKRSKPRSPEES